MRARKESKEWRDIDLGTPSDFNTERLDRFQAPLKRKAPWNRSLGMARPAPNHVTTTIRIALDVSADHFICGDIS
jgi:hypothetical protein